MVFGLLGHGAILHSLTVSGSGNQARSQAWANPGSARVAQKTARVAQIVKMYEIDILTLEKAL